MAHELDSTNGVVSFADSQTDAWHQLGQQVGHKMDPMEALAAANMLDWDVRKVPLRADIAVRHDADGNELEVQPEPQLVDVPGRYTILRTNPVTKAAEPLGVIGAWWQPFQNEATTGLLYNICDQSGAHIETIGALDGGRRTFVTMLMPDHMELTAPTGFKDVTKLYLAVFNHHDGQGALRAVISPVRVVCANTQRLAEANAVSQVSIRHTGNADVRLEEVRRILGLTFKLDETMRTEFEAMAQRERDDEWVRKALNEVFEADTADTEAKRGKRLETAAKVMEVYRKDDTVAMWYGTQFGAYNAVTRYLDHLAPLGPMKAATRARGTDSVRRAIRTITSTTVADTKAKAFTLLSAAN
ncbi:hypothetical protein SEA_EAGLEHORSE_86 [Mycobacterium phage Eaglehorse]|uniref:Uncharacterized protein n=2 Tax=Rosebushvirus rosebush TaxID=2006145 RepID=A0A5J6TVV0_9CAUD|nr:hypothetical protein SEA_EAGLEHORSE_86 [Mycobacterium phage Eaglehorse]QFG14037.1 hypothetical protein SEA_RHINOFORTE_85 [Mycobacterium phage Rhinoforte]